MRGAFITLEGIEGVGKSTSMQLIEALLGDAGYSVVPTREPGGTSLGERVRTWVLRSKPGELSAETEALLMFAARADHITSVIRPALAQGRWVLCDRFTDATFAYQGGGRGADKAFLDSLAAAVHKGLRPDLTVLLDAPPAVGLARIGDRELDYFEQEDLEFFGRVRTAYLDIAKLDGERVKVIDARRSIDEVQARIRAEIEAFIERFEHSNE
jgi:dTMP kinase